MDERSFIEAYPTTSNTDLAARFGVSLSTVQQWAGHHGLTKDSEYRRQVQRQNAEKRVVAVENA